MPALSPTMTTGSIGPWHKRPGDRIAPGDVLCEIETDKAQMDFEVQEEGFLARILIPTGTKDAPVGQPLAIFVQRAEDVPRFANYAPQAAPATPVDGGHAPAPPGPATPPVRGPGPATAPGGPAVRASPLARKTAAGLGLALTADVKGSGPGGRIVQGDVVRQASLAQPPAPSGPASTPTAAPFTDVPVTNMRRVIAERLTQSKQDIPHYYLQMDVRMDEIVRLRQRFNDAPALQDAFGAFRLSVNDFVVKAASLALMQVPEVNAAWHGTFIRQHAAADICVAVATPAGLLTPIVPRAEQLGLVAISSTIKELSARARASKLRPEQYQGGSFTISNLGMHGVRAFTAIINPPQACILAVGAVRPELVLADAGAGAEGGPAHGYRVAQTMTVTLSCDHRVVDGATGARWLAHFRRFLETPEQMIL